MIDGQASVDIVGGSRRNTVVGILWVLLGTAVFSLIFASGKLAEGSISAIQIVFFRYVSGIITVLALAAVVGGGPRAYRSERPGRHLLRAVCGSWGGICAIYAAAHMPIADATAIGLIEPVLVVVFAAAILGERVTRVHWLAAAVCAVGAAVVVLGRGGLGGTVGPVYLLAAGAALLGAVLIALEAILIKILSTAERSLTVLLYVNALATVLLIVPAWLAWRDIGWVEIAACLLLGPLAIAGQYCNIRGFRLADAAVLGPIGYSWIVFASLIGLLVFGEVPGAATIIGSAIVVGGGLWLARLPSGAAAARRPS